MSYEAPKNTQQPREQPQDQTRAPKPATPEGKRTRTMGLSSGPAGTASPVQQRPASTPDVARQERADMTDRWLDAVIRPDIHPPPVQMQGRAAQPASDIQGLAAQGISSAASPLPHLDQIQRSFGQSDVSGVEAHVGGPAEQASQAMGAEAYATGNHVAFRQAPDLHTAAHEAAHVVQQRAGVQLSGGVGEAGDRYEQHADQVADLVVQGKSAEHLFQQDAGGSAAAQKGGGVQRLEGDEEQSAYDALSESDKRRVEDVLSDIPSVYMHMLLKQRDAVKDLLDAVKEEEPPSFWEVVLKVAVEVALTAALGPIGTAIGAKIAKEGAKLGRQMIAAAVSNGVTKAIEESIKSGYGAVFATIPGSDPKDKFFKTQRNTLVDVSQQTASHFNTERKEQIRQSSDPLADAQALHTAVLGSSQTAYEAQRNKTMDQWISYRAKTAHGVYKDEDRANLGEADLDDTSQTGILGIEITTKESPPNPASPSIQVTEINLEGAHSNLKEIAKTRGTIADLQVPKSINGRVYGRADFEFFGYPYGDVGVGLSADGGRVWDDSDDNGTRWLKMFSTGKVSPDPEENDAIPQSEAFEGIRKLFERVGGSSLSSLS